MESVGPETIIIAGMPCSGKSSISRELEKNKGLTVLDLDEVIERKIGRHVKDIIRVDGIARFREIESSNLLECLNARPSFLSLGGGVLTVPENFQAIRSAGAVLVTLTASLSRLEERAVFDEELFQSDSPKRPLLFGGIALRSGLRKKLSELIIERWIFFKLAKLVVNTEFASAKRVAELLAEFSSPRLSTKKVGGKVSPNSVMIPVGERSLLRLRECEYSLSEAQFAVGSSWRSEIVKTIIALKQSDADWSNQATDVAISLDIPAIVSKLPKIETGEDVTDFSAEQFIQGYDGESSRLLDIWPIIEESIYQGFSGCLASGVRGG